MTAPSSAPPPLDDVARALALRLAVGGCADAAAQQQVLRTMLDEGSPCPPAAVIAALAGHVGQGGTAEVGRAQARLRALGGRLIVVGDADYPPLLADAWPELGAPAWVFVAGSGLPSGRGPSVAVVGTRRPTADGVRTAHTMGVALAQAGVTVVSGLARGIDQAAHRGAVDGGGVTVAVLGTGLGVDYPTRSGELRAAIASRGALVTELPPGVGPRPWHFLARNRIISGLASATVVVEGRERSGALQTARLAAGQGRDVWAVPGSINASASRAPLALLRDGATPLTAIDDFVATVTGAATVTADAPADAVPPATRARLSPAAAVLCDLVSAVPATTDALVATSRLPAHTVLVAVAELVDQRVGEMTPHGIVRR